MSHRVNLSSSYNMSLGFIPIIVTILLYGFISTDIAIYIGTGTGIIYSLFNYFIDSKRIPNFILYIVTAVLLVFSALALTGVIHKVLNWIPIIMEGAVALILLLIYLYKYHFIQYFRLKSLAPKRRHYTQAAESTVISARVLLLLVLIHLIILGIYALFFGPDSFSPKVLMIAGPVAVFTLSAVFNQLGISFFNKEMNETNFIPVVDQKGSVISRVIREDIPELRSDVMLPVVRIAIESHNMLFLCKNHDKVDTPLEDYVLFKESVEHAAKRIIKKTFPVNDWFDPRFSIKYKYKDEKTSRIVYLFIMHLDDDSVLCDRRFENGKLWTMKQIEQNLDKNYFSDMFEHEFDHLQTVIEIREKYKVS